RINIGFAALDMNADRGFGPAVYGFGASIFFVGYMVLEVPSNLLLHRFGPRRWIARILLTWGAVAAATAFVFSASSFYVLRFMLGVMEAGFLPGIAVYLTYWFPERYRARAVSGYIIAGSFSAVLGGPISTTVMTYANGFLGIHGWQWMFIAEGVPAMLLGLLTLRIMTERPADADWLSNQEKQWLESTLAEERGALGGHRHFPLLSVARDMRVWSLAGLFGCALVGIYGLFLWLPQIVKSFGHLTNIEVGFLSAAPPLLGALGTILIGRSSDRTGDRKFHLAFVYGMSALAIAGSAYAPNPILAYALLCVTGLFIYSGNPLFWSLAASFRTGAAGAATIALINTIAQFGGVVGPWSIGLVRHATGNFKFALLTIAAFLVVATVIALFMRVKPADDPVAAPLVGADEPTRS
ncbi:MAG TPA: MFS transporter, partial [Paraburkholderia sp.]